MTLREEMDKKNPRLAELALKRKSTAIRLFCVECVGGSIPDAKHCQTRECRLWPHAYAKWRQTDV